MPTVTVHRCILAARSGFFRALLQGGMGDAGRTELTLKVQQCQIVLKCRIRVFVAVNTSTIPATAVLVPVVGY